MESVWVEPFLIRIWEGFYYYTGEAKRT